jgi:hypothetical protein
MRNGTLKGQTADLEGQVRTLCQRIVDMSDQYQGMIREAEVQVSKAHQEKEEFV